MVVMPQPESPGICNLKWRGKAVKQSLEWVQRMLLSNKAPASLGQGDVKGVPHRPLQGSLKLGNTKKQTNKKQKRDQKSSSRLQAAGSLEPCHGAPRTRWNLAGAQAC